MTARAVAARIRFAATTDQPQPAARIARARWIGRFCAVTLLTLGLWSAATSTWQGTPIAVYALGTGAWCWRHQRQMRGVR